MRLHITTIRGPHCWPLKPANYTALIRFVKKVEASSMNRNLGGIQAERIEEREIPK